MRTIALMVAGLGMIAVTAVVTAAVTVVALHGWPFGVAPPAAERDTPAVAPPAPARSPVPARDELVLAAPTTVAPAAARDRATDPDPDPAPVADPGHAARPAAPTPDVPAPAIDYLRLSADLQHVSATLERFNRKLMSMIAASERAPDGAPDEERTRTTR